MKLFRGLILRPLRRDLPRTLLTVLSVALGVAVVVAIDLAGDAATGSFRSSMETLAGKTDLEITANGGVDERWIAVLAALPVDARFSPVIETQAEIAGIGSVTLYGLDLVNLAGAPEGMPRLAVSESLARSLHAAKGSTLTLNVSGQPMRGTVAEVPAAGSAEFVAMDIADAQQALGRYGTLDRIDAAAAPGQDFAALETAVRRALPASYLVTLPGARNEENQRMLRAFRWNLRVLSYISLVVGAFLIYNTIAISVVRRRAEIGILRAAGAPRWMVLWLFLAEALLFGVLGGLIGVAMGRLLAGGTVRLIAGTVNALYTTSRPAPVELTWTETWLALVTGAAVALVSAFAPAREAIQVAPTEAMSRGAHEHRARLRWKRGLVWSAGFAAAAWAASQAGPLNGYPVGGYVAALLAVAAGATATPALVLALSRIARPLFGSDREGISAARPGPRPLRPLPYGRGSDSGPSRARPQADELNYAVEDPARLRGSLPDGRGSDSDRRRARQQADELNYSAGSDPDRSRARPQADELNYAVEDPARLRGSLPDGRGSDSDRSRASQQEDELNYVVEDPARQRWKRGLLWSAGLAAAAWAASRVAPLNGYAALLAVAAAIVLAVYIARPLLGPNVEGLLAARSLESSLARTSVVVAALATAIAMMASVGIMVGSFRQTVTLWLDVQLRADLYVRPAAAAGAGAYPPLPSGVGEILRGIPGVAAVDLFHGLELHYGGERATLGAGDLDIVRRYGRLRFLPGEDRDAILRSLAQNGGPNRAIVSEPFANKHGVRAGDRLTLPIGAHGVTLTVEGIYYEYSSSQGYVIVDNATLRRYLPGQPATNAAVYLEPGADAGRVRREMQLRTAGMGVAVAPNSELRRAAIAIFDRTFAITWALEAVALVVAMLGAANSLLALVLDRRREIGLLRYLGASPAQIRGMILMEAGFLGLLAAILGLALGLALSLVLVFVVNRQSFGWTIQFHPPGALLAAALAAVWLVTVAAALYPARVAATLNPADVVHEE